MTSVMRTTAVLCAMLSFSATASAGDKLELMDTFDLEMATNPIFSPDGKKIVYQRQSLDVMTDSGRSNLWIMNSDGADARPLLSGKDNYFGATFSPDGTRLAYVATVEGAPQLYVRWMDTGATGRATNLESAPSRLVWSPDGTQIAFTMFAASPKPSIVKLPSAPQGATWTPQPKYIDKLVYRNDGAGYAKDGNVHLFVLPAEGGTPRQLTSGAYDHRGTPTWAKDGKSLIISANRHDDLVKDPADSNLFSVDVATGKISQLTDRYGADDEPTISPDGKKLAYTGYDDRGLPSHTTQLYVRDLTSGKVTSLTASLDRSVEDPQWSEDGKRVYFQYADHGKYVIANVDLNGKVTVLSDKAGGVGFSRPYAASNFTVGKAGRVAFTYSDPQRPADLAVIASGKVKRVTGLNEDVLGAKKLATIEEITVKSSVDGRDVQGWLALPADYDAAKSYPLILEIHGGPHAAYGPHWSDENQIYAAAGYVVLYTNPRGSTSYGEEFANLIQNCYPCGDYQDLMDLVDATLEKKSIDKSAMFVTGGSGGGVLTSWIVGKTDRFRAAVVAKPVINWTSFALTADMYPYAIKYWMDGTPWDNPMHYWQRSPLSLVGNVKTPTMLLVGEQDYRTPISESEQYYQALKIHGVETAMVRIQNSGHGIANKPSNQINKIAYILAWFEKYKEKK